MSGEEQPHHTDNKPQSGEEKKQPKSDSAALVKEYIEKLIVDGKPSTVEEGDDDKHKFWKTQPVNHFRDQIKSYDNQPHQPRVPKSEIPDKPYPLPEGYIWTDLDMHDTDQLKELYTLLSSYYVSDKDMMFRFDYSPNLLLWALTPPGYRQTWHVGVSERVSQKLVGFISAVPKKIVVNSASVNMVEINFLCLSPELRGKRLAPVLIQEITRRSNKREIFQAIHTAGHLYSEPLTKTTYLHRTINVEKLVQVEFYSLPESMTMKMAKRYYALPNAHTIPGFRPMKKKDIAPACKLLCEHLSRFQLYEIFNEDRFRHEFLPKWADVIYSYVVETEGKVTDFISFYVINSSVLKHPVHKKVHCAYLYYYAHTVTPLQDLVQEVFVAAKNLGFDVFNALNIMEDLRKFEKLKFGVGDGRLNYYLYNWKCGAMEPTQVGLMIC